MSRMIVDESETVKLFLRSLYIKGVFVRGDILDGIDFGEEDEEEEQNWERKYEQNTQ